jgi:hypothetical protein
MEHQEADDGNRDLVERAHQGVDGGGRLWSEATRAVSQSGSTSVGVAVLLLDVRTGYCSLCCNQHWQVSMLRGWQTCGFLL